MLQIHCPWCGIRDEAEFSYRGDASLARPDGEDIDAFVAYVYARRNPKGWTTEWWQHGAGCRQWLKVRRHTVTHAIAAVVPAAAALPEGTP